ncbi:MAG TPA: thiamine ABC transporter substrate binding subunit [Aliiroseovarius sp.]|nr:thiamine ABC transporter substrate binding subunit [Aliiroseovarius sp.]
MKTLSFVAAITLASAAQAAEPPVLTVYTYDSFVSDWGPGPMVEQAFEATCGCDLQFVGAGDGAELLARLRLEGARTKADVVLGLDSNQIADASDTGLFAPHGVDTGGFTNDIGWQDTTFLPFDWGYFAFVYDKGRVATPPTSFEALIASDLKIIIEDPRSSTPGLGLLLWVKAVYGDDAGAAWERLMPHVVTVTKGWSEAYGLFLDGEADMVLSYTTSPLYHLIAEGDDSKGAALFSDGQYMQIEVAAKVAATDQADLADQFMAFIVSDAFQEVIPTTNWMYPAFLPREKWPDAFRAAPTPEKALSFAAGEARDIRKAAIEEWLAASTN